jgi:PhnB protein
VKVQTYLFFDGRCDEALAFYKQAVRAEVGALMRFKDGPPADPANCGGGGMAQPPGDKVMHGEMKVGDTTVLISDGNCGGNAKFDGFALTIAVPTEAECDKLFNALADGGKVIMPAARTFFSPKFGMVADRFGVTWMILVDSQKPR